MKQDNYIFQKPVFGIYGDSNTGKTRLISRIIKKISEEGYNIAAIKISDKNISIDKKGKDTWKFFESGANIVVFSSPFITVYMLNNEIEIEIIIQYIQTVFNCDVILIEGANKSFIPKIKVGDILIFKSS